MSRVTTPHPCVARALEKKEGRFLLNGLFLAEAAVTPRFVISHYGAKALNVSSNSKSPPSPINTGVPVPNT